MSPKENNICRQVFDIDAKLAPIDDVVQLTDTALNRIQKAFWRTIFSRIPYVCFIAKKSVARKISGFDIKFLNDYSDDFCHRMTEKTAKMAALDGQIVNRDEPKIRAGFYCFCEQQKLFF